MFTEHLPVYQPKGRSPTTELWRAIASRICANSSSSEKPAYSIHFRPWLAISQSASIIADTCNGERANAVATPNTVAGASNSFRIRMRRQNPALAPYS